MFIFFLFVWKDTLALNDCLKPPSYRWHRFCPRWCSDSCLHLNFPSVLSSKGEMHARLVSGQLTGFVVAEHSTSLAQIFKKNSSLEGDSQCRWTMTQSILGKQPISSAAVGRIWPDDVAQNTIHPAVCISTYIINKSRKGRHPCICVLWQYHYNASLVRWNALKLEYLFLLCRPFWLNSRPLQTLIQPCNKC